MTDTQILNHWQMQLQGKFYQHRTTNIKNTLKRRGMWRMVKSVINMFL